MARISRYQSKTQEELFHNVILPNPPERTLSSYADLVMWSAIAAHPTKFMAGMKVCERVMGSTKKVTAEIIQKFNANYRVFWMLDDTFEVLPR